MAFAATMFAACSETEMLNGINEPQKAIGFETYSNKATRATENNSGSYSTGMSVHHDAYKVWAYRSTSDVLAFNGVVVNAADNTYSPVQYWDNDATEYNFYAAAPASFAWGFEGNTINKDEAYLTANVTLEGTNFATKTTTPASTFKNVGGDQDLLVSAPCKVEKAKFTTTPVNLQFIHILSRLNVIVKKGATAPDMTLKSLVVKNLKKTGAFDGSKPASVAGNNTRWDSSNPAVELYKVENYDLTTEANYVFEGLVIPQNITYEDVELDGTGITDKAYIEVTYVIGTAPNEEEYVAYYNLAALFGATALDPTVAFYEGWQNTLTITFNPTAIEFTASAEVWENEVTGGVTIN